MGTMASQITSLTVAYSTVYSGADQRKHQSSASLAFVRGIHRGPVNSPHKWPVTRKMFPFDVVIMIRTFTIAIFKCGLDSYDFGPLRLYRLYSIKYVHDGAFTEPIKLNNSGLIVQIIAIQSGADVVLGFIITVIIFTLIERSTSPTFFPDELLPLFFVISLIKTTKFGRNVRLIFRFLMILILGLFCSGRLRGLPPSDVFFMFF